MPAKQGVKGTLSNAIDERIVPSNRRNFLYGDEFVYQIGFMADWKYIEVPV